MRKSWLCLNVLTGPNRIHPRLTSELAVQIAGGLPSSAGPLSAEEVPENWERLIVLFKKQGVMTSLGNLSV